MELLESRLRITYGGTVLLDYGDLMQSEAALPQSHSLQAQAYLRSDWVDMWDRGAVKFKSEVNVVREYADGATAREAQFDHALEVAALRHESMTIEVQGGTKTYTLSAAAIESAEPELVRELGERFLSWTYSIIGSQLSSS